MSNHLLQLGAVETYYLKSGKPKYRIEIAHHGLNKHKVIKGDLPDVVRRKAEVQVADWEEKWEKQEAKRRERQRKQQREETAEELSREAEEELESLRKTLDHTLDIDDTVEWDSLKDFSEFPEPRPRKPELPHPPREPLSTDEIFKPRFNILDRLIPPWKQKKIDEAEKRFRESHASWKEAIAEHEKEVTTLEAKRENAVSEWEERKAEFIREQEAANDTIDREKERYFQGDAEAITEYCDLVLSRSQYPDSFPQEFDLFYNPDTKILVVDYLLPAPEHLPTLREVKYVKSRDELDEKHLSDRELNKLYDDLLYQMALRTIHELFEADQIEALDAVVFNGIVHTIDKSTGQEIEPCVLSIQAKRDEFLAINLAQVDPKQCFKSLKGVGSSKLHSITPVAPIVKVDKEDKRFVESREIAVGLDHATNLAAIDWEDFEHLIREVFQQEFAQGGGEVKVTHASRDGGVDAIAFDPDPIRGGKIVIQAKRYTNTVGVAAVRDLYGTVMNEGATKGILVTTSDYGPDAYNFAQGKPITLLNGANLLHLLERHGHRAKIDIKEAKRLASEERL